MMKSTSVLAAGMVALMTGVDAKEHYIVKEDHQQMEHKRPHVEETTQKCAYDTASFRLCGTYGANVKIGWEWEQEFYQLTTADKYYKINLDLFTKQGVDLEGEFFADRLYSNKTAITLEDFKGLLTVQWKHFYATSRSCIAVFYAIDDLIFEITTRQRFIEAHKNIIEHLWTLDNWDSPWALWIDELELSDYAAVELYKKEIQQADATTTIFGSLVDSTDCKPGDFTLGFAALSDASYNPVSRMMVQVVENGIDYMWANYD